MAYDDQDDDLNKWLQSQPSPNLTPQSSYQASAAEGGGPGVWSKAREMMDRQAAMQYQPQDYSKYLGKSEPAPDRMGHDFRTILAMALDLFGNKGRGAGQLMAAGNQTFDAKEAAWKRENGPQAQLARQMQVKQLENADRAAFNQDRSQLGAQIGQEVQLAGAQQSQQNADRTFAAGRDDHDDALAQQQLQRQVQEEQFAAGQGLTREQMAQSKALADAQRNQSAAQFRAGQDFTREQNELLRQHQIGLNDADNAALAERARLAAEARAAAAAARQPQVDARLSREFNKDTEYEQSLAQLLDSADKLTPKDGDIPGVGVMDGSFWGRARDTVGAALGDQTSKNAERMQAIKARLADLSQRMESGAAGPVSEELRYQIQVGAQPGATESEFRTALKLAREHVGGRLKGAAAGRESQARSVLGARQLDPWLGDLPSPQAPQAPQGFDPTAYGGVLDEDEEQ